MSIRFGNIDGEKCEVIAIGKLETGEDPAKLLVALPYDAAIHTQWTPFTVANRCLVEGAASTVKVRITAVPLTSRNGLRAAPLASWRGQLWQQFPAQTLLNLEDLSEAFFNPAGATAAPSEDAAPAALNMSVVIEEAAEAEEADAVM